MLLEQIKCKCCQELEQVQIGTEQHAEVLCYDCYLVIIHNRPYSKEDYKQAKEQGLDLDDWNDYVKFFGLGEEVEYE